MRFVSLAAFAVLLAACSSDFPPGLQTARTATNMEEAFMRMNGQPIHRFTLTPDNSTAEDNTTAAGGTAVQYTLLGGERICLQAVSTDAYVETIAAASMTAAGAKGFTVVAGQPLLNNCITLQIGQTKVSSLCTAAGPCLVKGFELH